MQGKLSLFMLSVLFLFTGSGCANESIESSEITEIKIAQTIDESNPNSGIVFEAFRVGLENHLGIPVVGVEDVSHLVGIEAMRAGNLDLMWGSPFVYLLASRATDVERVVVTSNPNAINKTVFITRSDRDDIQSIEDLEGNSFAFISSSSTSGFLYPMYHLMLGLDRDRDALLHSGSFFSTVTNSGSQDASIMGVLHGDFDAAAVGFLNYQSLLASGLFEEEELKIFDDTERIPLPGYIARSSLPREVIDEIRTFMLTFEDEVYFEERFNDGNTRFVEPVEEDITHLMSMLEALGMELEEF